MYTNQFVDSGPGLPTCSYLVNRHEWLPPLPVAASNCDMRSRGVGRAFLKKTDVFCIIVDKEALFEVVKYTCIQKFMYSCDLSVLEVFSVQIRILVLTRCCEVR